MKQDLAQRVSAAAFEERYAACRDPWQFASSSYENNRYRMTLQALAKKRYGIVYEPGCSIGVLTAQLASRAARVIATEVSPSAAREAQARCKDLGNVEIFCESATSYVPPMMIDLIVFSELGYYFERPELARIARLLASRLESGGEFVAVHWLGRSDDHVLHGDAVHETLFRHLPLTWLHGERHERFRLDAWAKS